jgi:hypothetical protein
MTREDIVSILKGTGIAGIGAALTYLSEWAAGSNFGVWTPLVVAALSILANVLRKQMPAK